MEAVIHIYNPLSEKAMPSHQNILFVINKNAGRKKNIDYEKEISVVFPEAHFFSMDGKDLKARLVSEIKTLHPQTVVAVGGDGTLTFVADAINGTDISMGIIPAGSANGMARELDIPAELNSAIEIIQKGKVSDVDLIRINDEFICFHLSDVGLNAQLIKHFEEGNVRGKLGYFKALGKTLFRKKRLFVSVMTKDKEVTREAAMVLIANATKYGTGALINPLGNIHDGFFEVVIIKKINVLDVLKMFMKFKRFYSKQIEVHEARRIQIHSRKKMHFQIDGEYLGKVKEINAEIMPGALKVILPLKN